MPMMRTLYLSIFLLSFYTTHAQYDTLRMLQDYCPGTCDGNPVPMGLLNGNLIISAQDETRKYLYSYNADGLLQSFQNDSTPPLSVLSPVNPHRFTAVAAAPGDALYFCSTLDGRSDSIRLFSWDGMNKPVKILPASDTPHSIGAPIWWNDKLYFSAYNIRNYTYSTHVYNPKTKTVTKVGDGGYTYGVVYKDKFYYKNFGSNTGQELFAFDPKTGNALMVADINPGQESGDPEHFIVVEDKLYFLATHPDYGRGLYMYDGVNAPKCVSYHSNKSRAYTITPHNGRLYMYYQAQPNKVVHTSYDITTNTTRTEDSLDKYLGNIFMASYHGKLIFNGYKVVPGNAYHVVYSYDAENKIVRELPTDQQYTFRYIYGFDVYNDVLYINGTTAEHGYEMFTYRERLPAKESYILYPNPTLDNAYIKATTEIKQNFDLSIYDAAGRQILWRRLGAFDKGEHNIHIPVSHLAAGVYIITLRNHRGVLLREKLVKL